MPTPKRYKLLRDLPGLTAGNIFELADDGGMGITEGMSMKELAYFEEMIRLKIDPDWFQELPEEGEIDILDERELSEQSMNDLEVRVMENRMKINEHTRVLNQLRREK